MASQSFSRNNVSKRIEFLSATIHTLENISGGGIENLKRLYKSRRFLAETEKRYPQSENETKIVSESISMAGLSYESITQNGRYALD